jgi:hypothetical protein
MNPSVNYNNLQDEESDAVLTAFVQAQAAPEGATLSEWTARYPAQARDLARLAAQTWAGETHESPVPETAARFQSIGLATLRAFRPEPKPATVIAFSTSPITSLLSAAEATGQDAEDVASVLDLPSALFWKLHRRLIAPDSVPRSLVNALAETINRTVDDVVAYLRMPPQMAAGASFRSDDAPSVGEQESFADALKVEPEMTDAQYRRWVIDSDAE